MANEAQQSLAGFAEAFGIVAGVSVGVAVLAVVAARALRLPLALRSRAADSTWAGGAVVGLFLAYYVLMPFAVLALEKSGAYRAIYGQEFAPLAEKAPDKAADPDGYAKWSGENQLRAIWAGFVVVPLLVLLAIFLWTFTACAPSLSKFFGPLPARIAGGIGVGLLLVPLTFALHALTVATAEWAGVELEKHPLTVLTPAGDGFGGLVFGLSVILVGPLVEELLFRGLIVDWASGDWHRPWIVLLFAALLAGLRGTRFQPEFGPTVFVGFLAVGLYAMQRFAPGLSPTFPTRSASAVWASAALFATAHASVWPTPIPLFLLGLGLGAITARTKDITAAVVVHGMFNAVSFLYLLRGGAG